MLGDHDDRELLQASRSNSSENLVPGRRPGERSFDYEPNPGGGGGHQVNLSSGESNIQSMDFEEMESSVWRMHQCRRFFQDTGHWWTASRRTTAWKWLLVIAVGVIIACIGYFVKYLTAAMSSKKYSVVKGYLDENTENGSASAYFSLVAISVFYAFLAGILCAVEPAAAGSGIPEIKAYLNGIDLSNVVRIRVLFCKVFGMCFSCASGLPLGKEGPMIHAGSIIGAAVSQGKTIALGFDTSWSKFQDLRNDRSKRDFVTFGAAAGVAAAFSAPIGGILFTLEEGASFWSTTLTFRAFFCAMVTELTVNLINSGFTLGVDTPQSMFDFGSFDDFRGYATFELVVFVLMGCVGGILGAFFNYINKRITIFRERHVNAHTWKRLAELVILTAGWSTICFVLPKMYNTCTPLPSQVANMTPQQLVLLGKLERFTCDKNFYNQLASLYLSDADTAMQQLFHFREVDGSDFTTFESGPLILFILPYFFIAAVTAGTLCPAGLFVPTLLAGATYGRLVGHMLNSVAPGSVTDSGTYALIGAASLLGGMSRMTIAGTVILLEACNKNEYLLPLMLTFAAARYSGNAINQPMYDLQIDLKNLPFLEGSLKTLGLLNYHPVTAVMARPVRTVREINRVGYIYHLLSTTAHNGFPVVNKDGRLRGLILRKTLCTILKLRAFSEPAAASSAGLSPGAGQSAPPPGTIQLTSAATIFHDTIERNYPHYPSIDEVRLDKEDMNLWVDVRTYMDTAPYSLNESSSIARCYRLFRSMGLRHLIVLDEQHRVTGMVTRRDITEHRLAYEWSNNGEEIQKFINVNKIEPALVHESESVPGRGGPTDELETRQLSAALALKTDAASRAGLGAGTASASTSASSASAVTSSSTGTHDDFMGSSSSGPVPRGVGGVQLTQLDLAMPHVSLSGHGAGGGYDKLDASRAAALTGAGTLDTIPSPPIPAFPSSAFAASSSSSSTLSSQAQRNRDKANREPKSMHR